MVSVCLCDPQPVVQFGLEGFLQQDQGFEMVGSSSGLAEAAVLAARLAPDVLVMERSYGMHALLETISKVKQDHPQLRLLVWASAISDIECFRLLQAGAHGILKKTASAEMICDCLSKVARGELWTEDLYLDDGTPPVQPRSRPLTPRESEVAALVAKGMKNREIAEALGIATGTVKIHLMHIFEKTGMRDRFELALRGLRNAVEQERGAVQENQRRETRRV